MLVVSPFVPLHHGPFHATEIPQGGPLGVLACGVATASLTGLVAYLALQVRSILWLLPMCVVLGIVNTGVCCALASVAMGADVGKALQEAILAILVGAPIGATAGIGYMIFLGLYLGPYRHFAKQPDAQLRTAALDAVWSCGAAFAGWGLEAAGLSEAREVATAGLVTAAMVGLRSVWLLGRAGVFLARVEGARHPRFAFAPASGGPALLAGAPEHTLCLQGRGGDGPFRFGETRDALGTLPSHPARRVGVWTTLAAGAVAACAGVVVAAVTG